MALNRTHLKQHPQIGNVEIWLPPDLPSPLAGTPSAPSASLPCPARLLSMVRVPGAWPASRRAQFLTPCLTPQDVGEIVASSLCLSHCLILHFQLFLFYSTSTIRIGIIPLPSHILPVGPPMSQITLRKPQLPVHTSLVNLPRGQACWFPEILTVACRSTSFPLTVPSLGSPCWLEVTPTYPDSFPLASPEAHPNASCIQSWKVHLINTLMTPEMTGVWKPLKAYSENYLLLPQNVTSHCQSNIVIMSWGEQGRFTDGHDFRLNLALHKNLIFFLQIKIAPSPQKKLIIATKFQKPKSLKSC